MAASPRAGRSPAAALPGKTSRAARRFGVYVHIPYCQVQCPYCTFFTVPRPGSDAPFRHFLAAVEREWELRVAPRLAAGEHLRTLYLGGGTPSDVPLVELDAFLARLAADVPGGLRSLREVTVECNPESATPELLDALRRRGVTRISLGVQSLADQDLRRLGRVARRAQVRAALDAVARRFERWSADLIVGIPGSNRQRLEASLAALQAFGAPHVSFYCLELPAARARLLPGAPWSERRVATAYAFASRWLEARGYEHYEISSAALPGQRAQHNSAYWQRLDYVGIGPGAHSLEQGVRRANRADLRAYLGALKAGGLPPAESERLSRQQIWRERLLLGLRRREGVSVRGLRLAALQPLFVQLERRRLGRLEEGRFRLLPEGWMLSDSIVLQCFTEIDRGAARVDKGRSARLHST